MSKFIIKCKLNGESRKAGIIDPKRLTGRWALNEDGEVLIEYHSQQLRYIPKEVFKKGFLGIVTSHTIEEQEWVLNEKPEFYHEKLWSVLEVHEGEPDESKGTKLKNIMNGAKG